MRIPKSPFMERLVGNQSYSLVPYINEHVKDPDKLTLIPFIFSNNDTFLYYNHNLRKSSDSLVDDPFKTGLPKFTEFDPHSMWDSIIHDFVSTLSTNFAQGFAQLSRYGQSVRQYLSTRNFSFLEINWLETFLEGTGHFDVDLTEIVLEDWLFGTDGDYAWTTIAGGMSRLVNGMEALLTKPILYSQRVTAISQTDVSPSITVTTSEGTTRNYDHVINTAPLGAMQAMDMSTLQMSYTKESAIRMINYDDSMKIGIKFKSRWWQDSLPVPIFGGQSTSDLPIRTCVYPSYGINTSDAAAVMIASYTWGQDASRLASYLSTPSSTAHLLNLTLSSLALLNNVSAAFLQEQYVSHFAHSWYSSEFSIGAFPEFAPGQFAQLMPELMTPVGKGGRVHLGGDALSAGHAWVVGALNAAYRCVREVLEAEGEEGEVRRLEEMWGPLVSFFSVMFFEFRKERSGPDKVLGERMLADLEVYEM